MIHEPTSEVSKNHPPEMSRNVYNAFYLRGCDVVEHSPNYAACLRKIEEAEAHRPMAYCPDCNAAIAGKRCGAVEMRDEEKLKGVALYFFPSQAYQNRNITNLTPENELPTVAKADKRSAFVSTDSRAANFKGRYQEYMPKARVGAKPVTVAAPPVFKSAPIEDGFAAAINAAMRETLTTPVFEPIKVAAPPILKPVASLAGESPLQYARRIAAFKQSQKSQQETV